MKSEKEIQNEVEKTMRSLDGIERATTDDYFYARLQARLEQRQEATLAEPGLTWVIAAVIVIILMNIVSVIYYAEYETSAEEISQEEIIAFTEEYELTTPMIYEQNMDE